MEPVEVDLIPQPYAQQLHYEHLHGGGHVVEVLERVNDQVREERCFENFTGAWNKQRCND